MRVVCWGTYDTGKPRARILLSGLRTVGVDLQEIHAPIWDGIEDKSQVRGIGTRVAIVVRWLFAYPGLIWRLLRTPRPDLLLIGYPGILDILIAAPIARLRRIPLAWDVFLSLYDTICEDRRLLRPGGISARALHWLERFALRRADVLFMDTRSHAARLEHLFNLPEDSCGAIWVGVESRHFPIALAPSRPREGPMRVLFYGQFIPLHGIETIVAAAKLLRQHAIHWQLIGHGQETRRIRELLDQDPLPNVQWDEWVEYRELGARIAAADLCLGIFGTSGKAASVIPNKVFQIVAAGRPLITRDSPAIRELLAPSPPCVRLVEAGDPQALADAVLAHHKAVPDSDMCECHAPLADQIGAAAIGRQFLDLMRRRITTR